MLLFLAFGCLINEDLYDRRLAELRDGDGDGYQAISVGGADCDDADGAVFPGAVEVPYDGIDQDCSEGDLEDVDGDGSAAVEAGGTDCEDANASVYPGASETWANGFRDNDCDGDAEPTTTLFGAVTWYGPMAEANAGAHLQPLDDLDGDGRAEWAVSAYFDSSRAANGGAVYVGSGGAGGDLSTQRAVHAGGGDWFLGTSLERLADLDGDGLGELLIGATGMESGRGGAFVVTSTQLAGSLESELPGDARLMVRGVSSGTYAGASVAALGDLDGDGLEEIAVSAPYLTVSGFSSAGRVYVIPANAEGELSLADSAWTWDGYFVEGALGNHVQAAGDQDGDGYDDVLLAMNTGVAAWIAPGGGSGGFIDEVASVAVYNPESRDVSAVEMVGDVDGDGTRDLLITHDYLALHIDLTGTPGRLLDDDAFVFVDTSGSVVASAVDIGDRDGDGLAETLLGSPLLLDEGTGWIGIAPASSWLGGAPALSELSLTARSVRAGAAAGSAVALVDDTDGDGQTDILVGAPSDDEGGENAGGVIILPAPE